MIAIAESSAATVGLYRLELNKKVVREAQKRRIGAVKRSPADNQPVALDAAGGWFPVSLAD